MSQNIFWDIAKRVRVDPGFFLAGSTPLYHHTVIDVIALESVFQELINCGKIFAAQAVLFCCGIKFL